MAGLDMEFAIGGDLDAALTRAIAAATDLTPVMMDIAGHLADETRARFDSERDPMGVPWKKSRRAQEEGGQTLTDSGDLRGSIREDWGKDFAAAGPERSGGAAIYAAIHQWGGTIFPRTAGALKFGGRLVSRVVMPKRSYLGWTEDDDEYALQALGDHIAAAFGGSAGGATK